VTLDSSVVPAILQREPGWQQQLGLLLEAEALRISAGTLQELLVVAHCRGLLQPVEQLPERLDADLVPVDAALARHALTVYQRFGKGQGHGAQLNFGDGVAAALAGGAGGVAAGFCGRGLRCCRVLHGRDFSRCMAMWPANRAMLRFRPSRGRGRPMAADSGSQSWDWGRPPVGPLSNQRSAVCRLLHQV